MPKRIKCMEDPVIVFVRRDNKGILKSVFQYVNPKKEKPSGCLVNKMLITLAPLYAIAILIGLIAALIVVYFAKPPAFYQENCARRSCFKNFGFICKNQTCVCPDGYTFIDKCTLKKTYTEQCNLNIHCTDNTNLVCLNGKCSCNSTQYWNGKSCLNKASFGKWCKTNDHCLNELFLYCHTTLNQCICNDTIR